MSTDPTKVQAMVDWPKPSTIKALRGFLGLTGYNRKYVANYGHICISFTALLKKEAFDWNDEADASFEQLKIAMTTIQSLHFLIILKILL